MEDLVRWLGKQLDEDEEIAREAGERSMEWRLVTPLDDAELGDAFWLNPPEKYHAERHDPDRVLRELAVKRQNLAELQAAEEAMDEASRDGDTARYNEVRAGWVVLRRVVRRDAAVYADRPGYQDAWRP